MKKILVVGGVAIAAVVVIALVLVGKINPIVKSGVEKTGPMILKAPVTLKGVNISFFSGSGELKGFTVGNPEGYKTDYAFQMDRLKVNLDVKSVTSDKIHIQDIIIDSPNIVFEGGFGKNNLSQLQKNANAFAWGWQSRKENCFWLTISKASHRSCTYPEWEHQCQYGNLTRKETNSSSA